MGQNRTRLSASILSGINGLLHFACYIVGWIGWAVMARMKPAGKARLLGILGKIVGLIMVLPLGDRIYHRFREHDRKTSIKGHTPRVHLSDLDTGDEEAVVLFSGGKDCTYVAWLFGQRFKKVHLLTLMLDTVENGDRCQVSIQRLKNSLGEDKFIHKYIDGNDLFSYFLFSRIKEHRQAFGPTPEGSACNACRIVAEAQALAYCKKHNIRWVASGLSPQSHMSFGQSIHNVRLVEKFMGRYGVNFSVPLWENPEIDPIEELYQGGVIPDKNIGKPYQFRGGVVTQGFCPLGLWDAINQYRHQFTSSYEDYMQVMTRYRQRLEELCEAHLRQAYEIVPE